MIYVVYLLNFLKKLSIPPVSHHILYGDILLFFVTATLSTWRSQKGLMGIEITHTLVRQTPGETLDATMESAMLMAISAS